MKAATPIISRTALEYLRCVVTGARSPLCRAHKLPLLSSRHSAGRSLTALRLRRSYATQPADQEGWVSILDKPQQYVSAEKRHGPGLIILALIPIIAFGLGTWQIKRLEWKTELIARYEDRLVREPLPLPPTIDASVVPDFDYRRVYATGKFRHDQEMLVGPRMHDGEDGYQVITPLERGEDGCKILVGRGWISKKHVDQATRPEGVPTGEVTIKGLLRVPFKKNRFTPTNDPAKGKFYFPDIQQMAELTGSEPVWVEETMFPEMLALLDRAEKGIPIGRAPEVNLRNNHTQYIFTWYSLSLATTIMFFMVTRKPPSSVVARARHSHQL